jgi:hypothetical protein
VIVHDLDVFSPGIGPSKTEAQLVIDSDTVLSRTVAHKGLQVVARRYAEVFQPGSDLKLPKLASRHGSNVREPRNALPPCKSLGIGALERLDHDA